MIMNPTPTLSGKEADNFFTRVAEGLKRKADFIPTPRLEEARRSMAEIIDEWGHTLAKGTPKKDGSGWGGQGIIVAGVDASLYDELARVSNNILICIGQKDVRRKNLNDYCWC